MPEKKTTERARRDRRAGKSASTQAGEYVKETMDHIREGKHGARSAKQAIAIGLSKARRAGVKLAPPAKGKASAGTRKHAARDVAKGARGTGKKPPPSPPPPPPGALRREGHSGASKSALSGQAKTAAATRKRRRAA